MTQRTKSTEDNSFSVSAHQEISEWAESILAADTLEGKLQAPLAFTDNNPGPVQVWDQPVRPVGLGFTKRSHDDKLPPFHEHNDKDKRAACLHRFTGHELLAVEIMAHALLAFPNAPKHFRKGLAATLKEEQEHVRLYIRRLNAMGVQFGDMPLFKHFWSHVPYLTSPKEYVSMMSLTFEMANLDFAPMYRDSFLRHDDPESAALMSRILHDELSHVSFGWHWLKKLKEENESMWDAWNASSGPLITPARAKGFLFFETHRREAGIDQAFIEEMKQAVKIKPQSVILTSSSSAISSA